MAHGLAYFDSGDPFVSCRAHARYFYLIRGFCGRKSQALLIPVSNPRSR
jgi:hypothetical protein